MISTNIDEVLSVLNGMATRMANPRPALQQLGDLTASKVMLGIMSEKEDPEGHMWAAWMPSTRHQREKKGNAGLGLLWDRGDLLASIRVQTSAQQVDIGTNLKEGKYLQEGTSKMAAREFLGWSVAEGAMAEQFVARYIEGGSL
jgi:hypothetical protein